MRSAVTLIAAFILSFLLAGVIQLQTAVWLDMHEEFIISLMVLPAFCLVVAVALGLALSLSKTARGVDWTATGLGSLAVLTVAVLGLWSVLDGGAAALGDAAPILGTIFVPCLVVVVIQWWLVRRRIVRRAQQTAS